MTLLNGRSLRGGMRVWLVWLLLQAPSVTAQDPSSAASDATPATDASLAFDQTQHTGLREGHVSLSWNAIEEASEYQLRDDTGAVLYRGEFERAFVSGLPDGVHTFTVTALNDRGEAIARSETPAVLKVEHWPLAQAWASFAVGLVVVVALVSVIITGAIRSRSFPGRSSRPSSPEGI